MNEFEEIKQRIVSIKNKVIFTVIIWMYYKSMQNYMTNVVFPNE